MPQVYQTYVTPICNGQSEELLAINLLEHFSPVAASMSKMALSGLQSGMKKEKLNSQLQQAFDVNKRHANSVINFIAGELSSAEECYKRHIETLDAKIKLTKKSLDDLNKRLKSHREYTKAV